MMKESPPIRVTRQDMGTSPGSPLAYAAALFKGTLQGGYPGAILKISGSSTVASTVQDRLERALSVPRGKIQIVPDSTAGDSVNIVIVYTPSSGPGAARTPGTPGSQPQGSVSLAGRVIETEVEVALLKGGVWEKKKLNLKLSAGHDGLQEVGTELTAFKRNLANSFFWGAIQNVVIKVKVPAIFKFESREGRLLFEKFSVKLKAVLTGDLKISRSVKVGWEAYVYVDVAGKPGVGAALTLFEF